MNYSSKVKLLILGESGVGKTALVQRYVDNKYSPDSVTTLGVEYKEKTIEAQNQNILIQIWDTAGQERFRTITPSYYKNVNGVLLVYDISDQASFDNISYWFSNLQENVDSNQLSLSLIGNKSDLQRAVDFNIASQFAEKNKMFFLECSAKNSNNVCEIFFEMAQRILQKKVGQSDYKGPEPKPRPSKQNKCCY